MHIARVEEFAIESQVFTHIGELLRAHSPATLWIARTSSSARTFGFSHGTMKRSSDTWALIIG